MCHTKNKPTFEGHTCNSMTAITRRSLSRSGTAKASFPAKVKKGSAARAVALQYTECIYMYVYIIYIYKWIYYHYHMIYYRYTYPFMLLCAYVSSNQTPMQIIEPNMFEALQLWDHHHESPWLYIEIQGKFTYCSASTNACPPWILLLELQRTKTGANSSIQQRQWRAK